jgi:hypothetical protein
MTVWYAWTGDYCPSPYRIRSGYLLSSGTSGGDNLDRIGRACDRFHYLVERPIMKRRDRSLSLTRPQSADLGTLVRLR